MAIRKLPLGIQDFPRIREEGYLYVDKTAFVHKIATEGSVYFLSRPRRFGKSLLLSTLGAYFEGKRELFHGLALERLEQDWIEYPVLRLDLNAKEFEQGREYLILHLNGRLDECAKRYGVELADSTPDERFRELILKVHEATGRRVVVLVDDCEGRDAGAANAQRADPEGGPQDAGREYDKPLLSSIGKPELHAAIKGVLKAFYGVLKSADAHLKFVLLTGVTKFGQVSVFSDLNQLTDLSLHPDYGALCGITEEELLANFGPELERLAKRQNLTEVECLAEVRRMYNGYRFEENAPGVYNPYSTLSALGAAKFGDYWFATGTPTFLVELMKQTDADLRDIDGVEVPASAFANYQADADRPLPVIYQSGYLTIQGYDPELRFYKLGYPNDEVRYGFLNFLLPSYTPLPMDKAGFHIGHFSKELRAGDVDAFLTRMRAFFAGFPYELNDQTERHYQVVFYLIFRLLGQYIRVEERSAQGRADAVVWTKDRIFVFEFKLTGTAEQALAQIDDKGYLVPYQVDDRAVVKVGVEFDKDTRNLRRWLVG